MRRTNGCVKKSLLRTEFESVRLVNKTRMITRFHQRSRHPTWDSLRNKHQCVRTGVLDRSMEGCVWCVVYLQPRVLSLEEIRDIHFRQSGRGPTRVRTGGARIKTESVTTTLLDQKNGCTWAPWVRWGLVACARKRVDTRAWRPHVAATVPPLSTVLGFWRLAPYACRSQCHNRMSTLDRTDWGHVFRECYANTGA